MTVAVAVVVARLAEEAARLVALAKFVVKMSDGMSRYWSAAIHGSRTVGHLPDPVALVADGVVARHCLDQGNVAIHIDDDDGVVVVHRNAVPALDSSR